MKKSFEQGELGYMYENAKSRMEYHPEVAVKYKKMIQDFPHFTNESDAIENAVKSRDDEHFGCQVWAKIGKDEEYYYIQDYFIATNDISILIAAEYIGMAQIFTA